MSESKSHIIQVRWSRVVRQTFLYGTDLTFLSDGSVRFRNPLMPSSIVINEWKSHGQYQNFRTVSPLPILKTGKTYQLQMKMASKPANTVYTCMIFYDRFDKELKKTIYKTRKISFEVPAKTYSYSIQLMNAGCEELVFERMDLVLDETIVAKPSRDEIVYNEFLKEDSQDSRVNIYFIEPGQVDESLLKERMDKESNLFFLQINPQTVNQASLDAYLDKIQAYGQARLVRLIAYGDLGGFLARYFACRLDQYEVYVGGRAVEAPVTKPAMILEDLDESRLTQMMALPVIKLPSIHDALVENLWHPMVYLRQVPI